MILPSRQHVTAFAAFSLPFWLLYLSDLMIGRRDYDMFAAETFGILFSTGGGLVLSDGWNLGRFISHHPGVPLTELSALYFWAFGAPELTFEGFRLFCIGVNYVTLTLAACWGATMAVRHDIPNLPILIASALSAVMPGVAALSPTLTAYHTYGVLLVPTGLGVYLIADGRPQVAGGVYWMLGFLLSIMYLGLLTLIGVAAAVLVGRRLRLGSDHGSYRGKLMVGAGVVLFAWVVSSAIGRVASRLVYDTMGWNGSVIEDIGGTSYHVALGLVAVGVAWSVFRSHLRKWCWHSLGSVLLGWAVGVNLFAFVYPKAAVAAILSKGGAARSDLSPVDLVRQADLLGFLGTSPWHALILATLLVGCWAIVRSVRTAENRDRDRAIGAFIVVTVGLNLVSAADASLIQGVARDYNSSRYYNNVIVVLPAIMVWLAGLGKRVWATGLVVGATVFVLSLVDYARVVVPVSAANHALAQEISAQVNTHLETYPEGEVLSFVSYIPDACNVAQAFWQLSLRDKETAQRLSRDRRVRAAYPTLEEALTDAPTLIVSGRQVPYIQDRKQDGRLKWERPQGRVAMPAYLQVVFVEGAE
ncbi:MAG: hypothetical protein CME19_18305 [Gemmatimonadetes bacterium]|nr:hypothetical protein [Gemmatimonadota bacterium]